MKVLITGATGFVGHWLTRALVKKGYQVRILHRGNSSLESFSDLDIEKVIGDVTDLESLKTAMKGVDAVFHLAGLVGYSKAMHQQMVLANVIGTSNVIDACLELKIKRLLHFSSVVAIGSSFTPQALNEKSEFKISHLKLGYFETKKAAEDLVKKAVQEKGLDAVIVNPSTIYGPGDAKKGSRKVQLKVARGKFPFYTSGGVNIVHIDDVVESTIVAFEKGRSGERYILAGENITIKELFRMIAAAAGSRPPFIYLPNFIVHLIGKIGDHLERRGKKGPLNSENAWTSIMYHWFDSTKAQKELGLKPKPAREAINESVQWVKENGLLD